MRKARLLPNGNMKVPRASQDDGIFADYEEEVGPDDPEFAWWERWYKQRGQKIPTAENDKSP